MYICVYIYTYLGIIYIYTLGLTLTLNPFRSQGVNPRTSTISRSACPPTSPRKIACARTPVGNEQMNNMKSRHGHVSQVRV